MRLQKNTTLALCSVLAFAAEPERHISAAEIAERHDASAHHLAKVLAELARAGIVESVRGVGGGYRFAGNVRRLTLMDVIQIFEDIAPRPAGPRATAVERALDSVLAEIDEHAKATFGSITLATMLRLVARREADAEAARSASRTQRKRRAA
jgi:Rrf2 family protein